MNDVQLSDVQIQRLFDYVDRKNMKYKDLQYELVDHLATSIEEEMVANHELTFEKALNIVTGRFPITGFYEFVEGKETALKRFWKKKFSSFVLSFFKVPKIILTLLVIFSLHQFLLLEISQQYNFGKILLISSLVIVLIGSIRNKKNDLKKVKDKYLIVDSFYTINSTLVFISTFLWWIFADIININNELPIYFSLLRVALFVVYIIVIFSMTFVFPKYLFEEIEKNYKEYGIMKIG